MVKLKRVKLIIITTYPIVITEEGAEEIKESILGKAIAKGQEIEIKIPGLGETLRARVAEAEPESGEVGYETEVEVEAELKAILSKPFQAWNEIVTAEEISEEEAEKLIREKSPRYKIVLSTPPATVFAENLEHKGGIIYVEPTVIYYESIGKYVKYSAEGKKAKVGYPVDNVVEIVDPEKDILRELFEVFATLLVIIAIAMILGGRD